MLLRWTMALDAIRVSLSMITDPAGVVITRIE
jgi:hypothetical protein